MEARKSINTVWQRPVGRIFLKFIYSTEISTADAHIRVLHYGFATPWMGPVWT